MCVDCTKGGSKVNLGRGWIRTQAKLLQQARDADSAAESGPRPFAEIVCPRSG